MASYAVLGATGSTGQNIVQQLLNSPDTTINVFARSKAKLERIIPGISSHKRVSIFEGSVSDVSLIKSCIASTDAVFACLACNHNAPGTRIAQDMAQVIVAALIQARLENPDLTKQPKILVLSSASVNPKLGGSGAQHAIVDAAFSHIYRDLEYAEAYMRLHTSWLHTTFIQPGGLVAGAREGHALSMDKAFGFMSYADLAAGMIEVATMDSYGWKGVAVVPVSTGVKPEALLPLKVLQGILFTFIPQVYSVVSYMGLLIP